MQCHALSHHDPTVFQDLALAYTGHSSGSSGNWSGPPPTSSFNTAFRYHAARMPHQRRALLGCCWSRPSAAFDLSLNKQIFITAFQ